MLPNLNWKKTTLIIFIALAIRFILFPSAYWMLGDSVTYSYLGRNLVEGQGYSLTGNPHTLFPPLYPILIGMVYKIIGNLEFSGFLISLIFGIGLFFPFFYLAKRLYGDKIAWIAVVLVLFHGFIIRSSLRVMSEMLFTFLLYAAILISWKWITIHYKSLRYGLLGGIFLGMTYLTRPEGFLFFILIGSLFAFRTKLKESKIKVSFIAFLVSFFILSMPYMIFLRQQTGSWQLSGKTGFNLVLGEFISNNDNQGYQKHIAHLSDDHQLIFLGSEKINVIGYISSHRGKYLLRVLKNLLALERSIPLFISIFGIMVIVLGFLKQKKEANRGFKEFFVLSMWIPSLIYPFFFINARLLIPYLPLLSLWLARGIHYSADHMSKHLKYKTSVYLLTGFFLLYGSKPAIEILVVEHHPIEHKEMGQWIKENLDLNPNSKIVSRKPLVSFHAEAQPVILPYADTIEDLIQFLRRENLRFLIIDERYTSPDYKPILPLLNENNVHDGLILKHIIQKPKKIILYETAFDKTN